MTKLGTPCRCMFGCQYSRHVISLRNREAPLPPPPHAAAQLIKTPTFNKTPHYHNGKTQSRRKTLGLVCTLWHPDVLHAFFSWGVGAADFQTPIMQCVYVCLRMYVCVRVCVYSLWPMAAVAFSLPTASLCKFLCSLNKNQQQHQNKQLSLLMPHTHSYAHKSIHTQTHRALGAKKLTCSMGCWHYCNYCDMSVLIYQYACGHVYTYVRSSAFGSGTRGKCKNSDLII